MSNSLDPFGIAETSLAVQRAWMAHPAQLAEQFMRLSGNMLRLQATTWLRVMGGAANGIAEASEFDERFQDEVWNQHPVYEAIKESYLLYTRWLEDTIYATPATDEKVRDQAAFWARQALNGIAPSNFFWTNPVAMGRFFSSGGETLRKGLENLARDMAAGEISMVERDAFTVGKDLATTPGAVVFRNELVELIQYTPTTAQVRSTPIVLISPWINKYYILDLNEKKSLIRYLVAQGFTVFVTSWKNPTAEMRDVTLDDYLIKGARAVVDAASEICGGTKVHAVGYCIGGTILSALMAWYAAGDDADRNPVADWTLFTTLVDFSSPGEIDIFIHEEGIAFLERMMAQQGYLDGSSMAGSFRSLRANSLIWHYFVHSYLYGEELPKFDVLFWNADSTRMPARMHSFYLRQFYLHNRLVAPGGVTLAGRPLDLTRITQPLYAVGAEQDHIAPWRETFKIARHVQGEVRYVLATSGHILGIINPPVDPPKRRYWAGVVSGGADGESWREGIEKLPGSWWDDWADWLHQRTDEMVAAREPGSRDYPVLASAPGSYVFEK